MRNNIHLALLFAAIFLLQLGGCIGPLVKIEPIDANTISQVEVYRDQSILQNDNVKTLGIIEATSCKHLLWDPESSPENCIDQLKMKAARLGGNGIMLGYADRRSADFTPTHGINRNCWNTIECSAVAIITESHSSEKENP